MKITTNHHYRPILCWHDLAESEQSEYNDAYDDVKESSFFRFKDWAYDLNDFMRIRESLIVPSVITGTGNDFYGWDVYKNDSFFSSVLVKFSEDCEAVKVGLALS